MKRIFLPLFCLLALGAASLLAGCASKDPADSSIPWSRPADWEGRPPGMGGF